MAGHAMAVEALASTAAAAASITMAVFRREWRAYRAGGEKGGKLSLSAGTGTDKSDTGEDVRAVRADAFQAQI
jgi:hypothetical protein